MISNTAALLLTAGSDEEFFAIISLKIFMVFLVYIGFEVYDEHCKKKWRKEDEQKSNSRNC
jgi:hypothetical protein